MQIIKLQLYHLHFSSTTSWVFADTLSFLGFLICLVRSWPSSGGLIFLGLPIGLFGCSSPGGFLGLPIGFFGRSFASNLSLARYSAACTVRFWSPIFCISSWYLQITSLSASVNLANASSLLMAWVDFGNGTSTWFSFSSDIAFSYIFLYIIPIYFFIFI